jgi:hypothetical protein
MFGGFFFAQPFFADFPQAGGGYVQPWSRGGAFLDEDGRPCPRDPKKYGNQKKQFADMRREQVARENASTIHSVLTMWLELENL